jgi:hypothetical protein
MPVLRTSFQRSPWVWGLAVLVGARAVTAQEDARTVWRAMVGNTAVELHVVPSTVRAGFAGDSASVTLALRAGDLKRAADSIGALLRPRRTPLPGWSLRVEEPGVREGTLVLGSPAPRKGKPRVYTLFASDDPLGGVRDTLTHGELNLLVRKLREAAGVASPAPAVRKAPAARAPKGRPKAAPKKGAASKP